MEPSLAPAPANLSAVGGGPRNGGAAVVAALEAWLGTRPARALLLLAVAALYCWAWSADELRPTRSPAEERTGWWTWFDQHKYWQSAEELARGRVTPEGYYYPLGYAALGAPLARWYPRDPFLVANLGLVLLAAVFWWRLARGMGLNRLTTLVAGIMLVWWHAELLRLTLVIPWNTIATQAGLFAGLWLATRPGGVREAATLGSVAAAVYLVRPAEAACFAPLLAWAVFRISGCRDRVLAVIAGAAPLVVAVVAVGLVNLAVFGVWRSAYERISWEVVGFRSFPILQQAYWAFVDGGSFFGESEPALLFRYPWLLLVPAGAILWVRRSGGAALAGLGAVVMNWMLYVSYNDFVPSGIWRFSLIHYVSWSIPVLFALAVSAVVRGARDRGAWVGFVVGAVLLVGSLGVTLVERPVAAAASAGRVELAGSRPAWVRFPGVPLARVGELRLDGRPLRESMDYHIPYVPSDLKLLLGRPARGTALELIGEPATDVTPVAGTLEWEWRWEIARVAAGWRR